VAPDPYYKRLDDQGVRCAIVDVPSDIPIAGFRGVHVVDWLAEFKFWRFATQPEGYREQIARRWGTLDPSGGYGPTAASLDGHRRLRKRLEQSLEMKAALTRELLTSRDLDHLFVVFAEPHKAGHFFWKYMDATHVDHVPAEPYLRDALLSIYQLVDRKLAELASLLTEQDNLIVLADHGMQANYRGDHLVGAVLERLGLSGAGGAVSLEASVPAPTATQGVSRHSMRLRSFVGRAAKRMLPPLLQRGLRSRFGVAARIDWSQVQAFQLPTDRNTHLRINLRGREPQGIVEPGAGYRDLLSLLEREFRALVNPETGRAAVQEVFRVHEMYPGERARDLPDLAILWKSDAPVNAVSSPRIGLIECRVAEDRSGNHREEGFLLARGPDIRRGPLEVRGDILQIPATLLALHGVRPPQTYEMPALSDLLASHVEKLVSRVA